MTTHSGKTRHPGVIPGSRPGLSLAMNRHTRILEGVVLLTAVASIAGAQTPSSAEEANAANVGIEEVVVIGTRRPGRSAEESTAPIDVISGDDFSQVGNTGDITDNLRFNVPSFNATIASGDGDTFVRPTSLRGLAPDQLLVMVNGKRRHRTALIAEFVPSAGKGAHGPNIGLIPGIALERVEVLRDGASAQYGADAIAGVINLVPRSEADGGEVRLHYGQFYEGEQSYSVAGNFGLPLNENGFLNVSVEYAANEAHSRGIQPANAQALIDAGVPGVGQDTPFHDAPLAQSWGRAQTDNLRMFFNAGVDINDDMSLYAQSNYADVFGRYRFFYRNPNHITLRTLREEHGFDGLPTGFTPFFDGDQEDFSFVGGVHGHLENGIHYDFSAGYGFNEIDFFLNNTINQSLGLGPDGNPAQRDFDVGDLQQEELSLNADFSRDLSDTAHLAFGAEWREETFTVVAGEPAAWFGAGSSGFKGFEPENSGDFSRDNYALYAEIEQDLSDGSGTAVCSALRGFLRFRRHRQRQGRCPLRRERGPCPSRCRFPPAFTRPHRDRPISRRSRPPSTTTWVCRWSPVRFRRITRWRSRAGRIAPDRGAVKQR